MITSSNPANVSLGSSTKLGWKEVTRNREATWGPMQGIFVHLLKVEDSGLHFDISGRVWPHGDRDPSVFGSLKEIESYHADLAERTRALVAGLTKEKLEEYVVFDWSPGKARSTVQEVLIHAFIDEVAHLEKLICLMWQMDVKPPHADRIAEHIEPWGDRFRSGARSLPRSQNLLAVSKSRRLVGP